jgi:HEAT repeat protein
MGPKAKPAIPALREALQDLDARDQAAIALAKIGPEGVSVLLVAVRDGDCHLRGAALFGLAADDTVVGPDATEAIPALIKAVRDKSTEGRYRWTAALVLGKIGPAAKAAVPDLIELIADRPQEAILALGEIGPDARDAVPVITRALEQPWLRDTAAAALARIGTAPRNDWGVPPPVTDTGHPKQGGASERSAPPSIALPPSPYRLLSRKARRSATTFAFAH